MEIGDKVTWRWGKYQAYGEIVDKFEKNVERNIKGTRVKRKASAEKPAYLIRQEDGDEVLKSESELKKI